MVLAGNLLKDIQRMSDNTTTSPKEGEKTTQERNIIIIGHGAAGWVIQEASAWYSHTSTEAARRTNIHCKREILYEVRDYRHCARQLQTSSRKPIWPRGKAHYDIVYRGGSVSRRETNGSDGSNTSDSSYTSSILTAAQLSWDIKVDDKTDIQVRSEFDPARIFAKYGRLTSQPQDQPKYPPLAQTYGRFDAKDFPEVSTAISSQGSDSRGQIASPLAAPMELPATISNVTFRTAPSEAWPSTQEHLKLIAASLSHSNNPSYVSHSDKEALPEISRQEQTSGLTPCRGPSNTLFQSDNQKQLLRLANLYQHSGELRKSKQLYQLVMKMIADDPELSEGVDAIKCQIAVTDLYEGHIRRAQSALEELAPRARAKYDTQPHRAWEIERWIAVSFDMQGFYKTARDILMTVNNAIGSFQMTSEVTLLTKSSLALVSGHLGNYQEALALSKDVLQIAGDLVEKARKKSNKKGDTSDMARRQGALGFMQFDRATILAFVGRFKEAEVVNDLASENIQKTLGSKHVATLDCWSLKSRLYASTSRLPEAEEQCQKTLNVMRKEIGKEHPSTLRTLSILVHVYRLQARLTEALDNSKYLVDRYNKNQELGEQHPETINLMWELAEVYLARGEFTNALHLQADVVRMADRVLGKLHPNVLNYRSCLARVYCSRGSWTLSVRLCFEVLEDYSSIISELGRDVADDSESQDRLKSEVRKGSRLVPDRNSVPIQQIFETARKILVLDNDDFETINLSLVATLQCLGATERDRLHGNLKIAQEIHTKAYEYVNKKLGGSHVDTLSLRLDLALTELKSGKRDVISELREVTEMRKKLLGEDHPDTLAARNCLSVANFKYSDDWSESVEQAEVLRLCIQLLGQEHPITNSTRIDLANSCRSMGKLREAEDLRLQALSTQISTLRQPATGSTKSIYEEALERLGVQINPAAEELEPNSKFDEKKAQDDPPPSHCHADIISNLAQLALIYVDLGVQDTNQGPQNKKMPRPLVSDLYDKAIIAQRAVVEQQSLAGPPGGVEMPEIQESISTLGLIYQAAGDTEKAIEQYNIVQNSTKESSALHFTCQSNLGTLLFTKGDYAAAEEIQTKAYEKREKYGPDVVGPKEFVIAVFNLALTKKALGKDDYALKLMEKALKLSRDAFGHSDYMTGSILDTLMNGVISRKKCNDFSGRLTRPSFTGLEEKLGGRSWDGYDIELTMRCFSDQSPLVLKVLHHPDLSV